MDATLLQLPWQVQIALGGGFLGYLAAYSGLREKHQQIDVAFRTVVFGLVASAIYGALLKALGVAGASVAAVASSIGAGLLWRAALRDAAHGAMRRLSVTFIDDDPTALFTLSRNNRASVTQVTVYLNDGTRLRCGDTKPFAHAGLDPLIIGADGSVALYVTASSRKGKDGEAVWDDEENILDNDWGHRVTVVQASQIARLSLRMKARPESRTSVLLRRWRRFVARFARRSWRVARIWWARRRRSV